MTGGGFNPGFPGIRELSFTWRDFVEHLTIKVTAGDPAQLKLVDGPQEVAIKLGAKTLWLRQWCLLGHHLYGIGHGFPFSLIVVHVFCFFIPCKC